MINKVTFDKLWTFHDWCWTGKSVGVYVNGHYVGNLSCSKYFELDRQPWEFLTSRNFKNEHTRTLRKILKVEQCFALKDAKQQVKKYFRGFDYTLTV